MSTISQFLDRTFYPNHGDNWDNVLFREKVLPHLNKSTILLDAGAGRGYLPWMNFKDLVGKAVGVDPSEAILSNPYLHEAYVGFCDEMPFLEANTFDVAVSNNVLEHVAHPDAFLKEINRVMKYGAILVVKTPNKYHYMTLIARFTPTWFHALYNKWRGRPNEDTFPTQYKINSKSDLKRLAAQSGFEVTEFTLVEGRPEYLRLFAPLYLLGILYERVVNLLQIHSLKIVYFAVLKKI